MVIFLKLKASKLSTGLRMVNIVIVLRGLAGKHSIVNDLNGAYFDAGIYIMYYN